MPMTSVLSSAWHSDGFAQRWMVVAVVAPDEADDVELDAELEPDDEPTVPVDVWAGDVEPDAEPDGGAPDCEPDGALGDAPNAPEPIGASPPNAPNGAPEPIDALPPHAEPAAWYPNVSTPLQ